MKTEHTPGPWTFEREKASGPVLTQTHIFAHGEVIGVMYGDEQRSNSQANACVTAAGPTMLAALRTAEAALLPRASELQRANALRDVRAAIAKATTP